MFKLRNYQQSLVDKVVGAWGTFNAVLLVLATGGGKTVIFSTIVRDHPGAAVVVAHRKEIEGQISIALARLGVKHRLVAPESVVTAVRRKHLKILGKSFLDAHARIGVASVQTLTSKASAKNSVLQKWLDQITLAVFDEGHHYVDSGLWSRAVDRLAKAKMLLVSATPDRADGKGLGLHADGYAQTIIEGPSTAWLIDEGFLSPFVYKAPMTDLDLNDVPLTAGGEVNAKKMRERITHSHLVGNVVEHYQTFALGKPGILFANDVETAHDHADAFVKAAVKAVALSGKTDGRERDKQVDLFESGAIDLLSNVDLFDEGFDVPGVSVVILSRITESLAKYLQMVGRGLRPVYAPGFDLSTREGRRAAIAASDKPYAIIIDPVRNWERHGMPNWPRSWTLDRREKKTKGEQSDTVPQRVCVGTEAFPGCTQPYEAFFRICPYCGAPFVPAGRSAPEAVDGVLMDLDVEAMAALFAKMAAVDMKRDEYAVDQISRNIPPRGRGQDRDRYEAAQYRRKVLRELVAWWVGMQPPGRELAEKHARFYHRFGVDIGTAFTLDAKDTDALVATIKRRFDEDMI